MFKPLFGISLRVRGKRQAWVRDQDDESTGLYLMLEPAAQNGFTTTAYCLETMVSKEEYESVNVGDQYQLQKT